MQELGQQVGLKLRAGGVGRALGILELTSPTFVIAKIYPSAIPLVHVDAYRLIGKELAIFDDLDLESRIPVSITIIEWGSGFVERLSESFIEIDFQFGADPDERMVSITGLDR
jgi:tRNA threonylcarbamoyladenosine biosynthesis protein TsaE